MNCGIFTLNVWLCLQEEIELTDEEDSIKAYLSDREPLSSKILDKVLKPYWEEEPFR